MAKDLISAHAEQDITNELGTLQHNTVSVDLGKKGVAVEPRPTFPDAETPATGSYGRGAFIHTGIPLYVTESQIANGSITTSLTSANLSPLASACFSILDDGTDRVTIIQNAGYSGAEGSLFYASNALTGSIANYTKHADTFTGTQDASEASVAISDDGTKLYTAEVSNASSALIYQYTLSTAWDITSAVFASSYDTGLTRNLRATFVFGDSGTKVYVGIANGTLYQHNLSTAWDITSASDSGNSHSIFAEDAVATAIAFNTAGTVMQMVGTGSDAVHEYTLSPAWDLSTLSAVVSSTDISTQSTNPTALVFNATGTKMYVGQASAIDMYDLTIGFDTSTAIYNNTVAVSGTPQGLLMHHSNNEDLFYITDTGAVINKYVTGDTFTAVSDVDAPGSTSSVIMARGCPVLNGRVFTLGAITTSLYNSNLNSITAWSALDFVTAEREADYGCFLGKQRDHIVYIGTRSIEFFYDSGTATGSPLLRRQDVQYNVGSVFPNSCCQYGDDIYFFGTNAEGETDLYRINNFQVEPFKHPYLQTKLRELDINAHENPYTNKASNFQQVISAISTPRHGLTLILTINGTTYAFQPSTGHIAEWYPGADVASSTGLFTQDWATNHLFPIVSSYSYTPQGTTDYIMMSNGYTTSVVYNSDLDDFAGTSTAAPSFFYTPKWNGETLSKKKVTSYYVHQYPNLDSGVTSSDMTLSWVNLEDSVDFGATLVDADFTNGRTVSSNYSAGRLYRGGITRERVHKLLFTPAKAQLVAGLEINYSELST